MPRRWMVVRGKYMSKFELYLKNWSLELDVVLERTSCCCRWTWLSWRCWCVSRKAQMDWAKHRGVIFLIAIWEGWGNSLAVNEMPRRMLLVVWWGDNEDRLIAALEILLRVCLERRKRKCRTWKAQYIFWSKGVHFFESFNLLHVGRKDIDRFRGFRQLFGLTSASDVEVLIGKTKLSVKENEKEAYALR